VSGPDDADTGWLASNDPAFTTGTAAELLGVTQAFLRQLGAAGLLDPHRSGGGHRRYSRHELELAARARHLVDEGLSLDAACRIVVLQADLAAAHAQIRDLQSRLGIPGDQHAADEPDGPQPARR
jgi:excisionase family DNA binding protein